MSLVKQVVDDYEAKGVKDILLDGFPRTIPQAEKLSEVFPIDVVISLDIPTEIIVQRISNRWTHIPSGRVYAYDYNPPKVEGKDDVTGEALSQRDDDKAESVRARLEKYSNMTKPLVTYFSNKGVLKNFQGTKSNEIYVRVKRW